MDVTKRNIRVTVDVFKYIFSGKYVVYVKSSTILEKILRNYIINIEDTAYMKDKQFTDLYGFLKSSELIFYMKSNNTLQLGIKKIFSPTISSNQKQYENVLTCKLVSDIRLETFSLIFFDIISSGLSFRVNNKETNINICNTVFNNYITFV